jgi:hypothetical protein
VIPSLILGVTGNGDFSGQESRRSLSGPGERGGRETGQFEGQEPEPADSGISEETTHLDSLPGYKKAVSAFQTCIVDQRLAAALESG